MFNNPRIGCAAVLVAVALFGASAEAQVAGNLPQSPTDAFQQSTLTPDQIRDILMLRALQMRGGRGVRTGVPQFVPFGNPWAMGMPMMPAQTTQPRAAPNNSSTEKRAAARAAREEKNRLAREKAKAKREEAAQARLKARAEARAKAAAKAKDGAQADDPAEPARP